MRLFVAVNLPDAVRRDLFDAAAPVQADGPNIRWLESDNFHITLKFLGSVPDHQLDAVQSGVAAAGLGRAPFHLGLSSMGAFPNFRRARVYWVGVEDDGSLAQLQGAVEQSIAPLGYPTEGRPFHPHVTVGRVSQVPAAELRTVEESAAAFDFRATISVNSVELMESKLSPKGARYQAIYSALLGGKK